VPNKLSRLHRPRRGNAAIVSVLMASLLGSISLVAPLPIAAAGEILPAGFSDEVVMTGLTMPTKIRFAPNGKIFISEKSGIIKMFDSLSDTTPTTVADLRTQVYNLGDKGMLGLAVDNQYPTRPYVYALFSYDAIIGGQPPRYNDGCKGPPNGPGGDGCYSSGRLVRLTLDSNGQMTSQKTLVEAWCGQFDSHSIGTVTMGPDGYLYAGAGDGASYAIYNLDYGNKGGENINPNTGEPYTPVNPCGDPNGSVGVATTLPDAQGGALRAQSPRRPHGQPTVLNGTIIRVNPDDGNSLSTNPMYYGGRDENERRIVTYGLRNPYRFTFRPGSNELWVGDVGSWKWEEIIRITGVTSSVKNNGWPCWEGNEHNGGWDSLDTTSCETLYAQGSNAVNQPFFQYRHNQKLFADDTCSTNGGVVSGITFEQGANFPSRYNGALFFTDYARSCIWAMLTDANGVPDPDKLEVFESGNVGAIDLEFGPDGKLYYTDIGYATGGMGTIHRVSFDGSNQPPIINASANPTQGAAPLSVHFDASATVDPDGDSMTFNYDFDDNGSYDASGAIQDVAYSTGQWTARLRVDDGHGHTAYKTFEINAGNTKPEPVIDTPSTGAKWSAGQPINFSGHATDDEDGNIPAADLSWRWLLHHCTGPNPGDCHAHQLQDFDGVASDSVEAPDHEFPSYLEVELTATDSAGASATVSRTFDPRSVSLTFDTNPSGLTLNAAGNSGAAPIQQVFIQNAEISLEAPATQSKDGLTYTFQSWSDGGARSRVIHAPSSNTTYTANYTASAPSDAPNTCANATSSSSQDTWLSNTISSTSDEDWYRFSVSSKRFVRILLGNLAANYRIDLYRECGTLVASSNRFNKEFEEIYKEISAGTYRVRVKSYSGSSNSVSYGLKFMQLSDGVQILSSTGWINTSGTLNIDGELLNNTDNRRRLIVVRATLYDEADQVIGTKDAYAWINVVRPRTRSPFRVSIEVPDGYDHYSVKVNYSQKTDNYVVQNIGITSSSQGTDANGAWFKGSFKNKNGFSLKWTTSLTSLFDKWGNVMTVDSSWTKPITVPANGTGQYDVRFGQHYENFNKVVVSIQATRGT
jgi:glucose/arabinose dehydrogenase